MEPLFRNPNNYIRVIQIPVVMESTAANPQKEIIKREAKADDNSWLKTRFFKFLQLHNRRLKELSTALDKAISSI